MAARPQPLSALTLCKRLSTASVTRLEGVIKRVNEALKTNFLLTASERSHYEAALAAASAQLTAFKTVAKLSLPKPPAAGKKRGPGRPSKADLEAGEALAAKSGVKVAKNKAKPAKKAARAKVAAKKAA